MSRNHSTGWSTLFALDRMMLTSTGTKLERWEPALLSLLIPHCQQVSLSNIIFYLHCEGSDDTILAGSSILSGDSLHPPFASCPNQNFFQQFFALEFHHDGYTYFRAVSVRLAVIPSWRKNIYSQDSCQRDIYLQSRPSLLGVRISHNTIPAKAHSVVL